MKKPNILFRSLTSHHHSYLKRTCLVVLLTFLCIQFGSFQSVHAAEMEKETGTSQLVTGAACFFLTPVYGAFKLAFAGAGAIVGGLAWAFTGGDEEAAQRIWDASLKGTYIITPDHLSGQESVEFVGSSDA